MFRFGISVPGLYLTNNLFHPFLSRRGVSQQQIKLIARAAQVVIAFTLTAAIHAAASATSFPACGEAMQRPVLGSGAFFAMQGVGVVVWGAVQNTLWTSSWWKAQKAHGGSGLEVWMIVGNVVNLLGTAGWLYLTAPLFADDVARCGIWLFEPLPVSPFRGLRGEGWWRWGGRWARVEAGSAWGRRWWEGGVAVY
jgi:hypothetical protein